MKKVSWSLPGIGDGAGDKEFIAAFKKARRLLRHKYVTGVSAGFAVRGGKTTNKRAICIHVTKKVRDKKLSRSKRLPRTIGGVDVDVIVSNFKAHQMGLAERNARRVTPAIPAQPGVAIKVETGSLGTLGMLVVDKNDGRRCILTAAHVLDAPEKTPVYQPGPGSSNNIIGQVGRSGKECDAAIAFLSGNRTVTNFPWGGNRVINGVRMVRPVPQVIPENYEDETLVKSGCMTGLTRGVVRYVGSFMVPLGKRERLVNGFILIPVLGHPVISERGDSGSIWYDENTGEALGLHVGGDDFRYSLPEAGKEPEYAIAYHITEVFTDLKIDLPP